MHYLMLITFAMQPGETSEQARDRAYGTLLDDRSFCGDGGRFGSPVCDWFVIGGRWSGYLRESLIGPAHREALKERFPKLAGWYGERDVEPHRAALDALWREFGGAGPSPYRRHDCANTGYDDDALPVDQAIYDRFLAAYRGESERKADSWHRTFADLDGEDVDDSFIGRKWIAVVDYHN
jgi:hypothetical protein